MARTGVFKDSHAWRGRAAGHPMYISEPHLSTSILAQAQRPLSAGGSLKRPRSARCMECATCLKPALKKACLRNKALRSAAAAAAVASAEGGVPFAGESSGGVPSLEAALLHPLAGLPPADSVPSPSEGSADAPGMASRSASGSFCFPVAGSLPTPRAAGLSSQDYQHLRQPVCPCHACLVIMLTPHVMMFASVSKCLG